MERVKELQNKALDLEIEVQNLLEKIAKIQAQAKEINKDFCMSENDMWSKDEFLEAKNYARVLFPAEVLFDAETDAYGKINPLSVYFEYNWLESLFKDMLDMELENYLEDEYALFDKYDTFCDVMGIFESIANEANKSEQPMFAPIKEYIKYLNQVKESYKPFVLNSKYETIKPMPRRYAKLHTNLYLNKSDAILKPNMFIFEGKEFNVMQISQAIIKYLAETDCEYDSIDAMVFYDILGNEKYLTSFWDSIPNNERKYIFNNLEVDETDLKVEYLEFDHIVTSIKQLDQRLRDVYKYTYACDGAWINKIMLASKAVEYYDKNIAKKDFVMYKTYMTKDVVDAMYDNLLGYFEDISNLYYDLYKPLCWDCEPLSSKAIEYLKAGVNDTLLLSY